MNIDSMEKNECIALQESAEFAEYDVDICLTGVENIDEEITMLIDFLITEAEIAGEELSVIGLESKGGLYISQENFSSVDDVKSTFLKVSLNTGGAHPNTFFHTWTYHKDSGEILSFSSLFQQEHNPLWTIYPIVKESLLDQMGEGANEAMIDEGTGESDFENYQSFVLDGEKLVFFFEPYRVAPYAVGPQQVEIPFEELQVIFQPPFLDTTDLPITEKIDHSTSCIAAEGKWNAEYNECEMISQSWCEGEMGVFKSCESACRHDPTAEMCTMQCVQVCEF